MEGSDLLDKLPGEIRNRIYRMALIEEQHVFVTKSRFEEAGLLKVCKQVRREAGPIFYVENRSAFNVSEYDAEALCKFHVTFGRVVSEFDVWHIQYSYWSNLRPSWTNLFEWCRAAHGKRTTFVIETGGTAITSADPLDPKTAPLRVAAAMFAIVEKLREQSWEEVEEMLLAYRDILGSMDRGWMD